jgi:hypothetical protein
MANKNLSSFDKIIPGQFLSETQYYRAISKDESRLFVKNERGLEFYIGANIVEEGIYSASQFIETLKISRTELIKIFNEVGDTVFTVCFNKQPTADSINTAIESANKGKIIPIKDLKKLVKEERVLTGYLISSETGFGRSMVIDLEGDRGNNPDWDGRMRQVDHRTLNWLIYKNVKYIVK